MLTGNFSKFLLYRNVFFLPGTIAIAALKISTVYREMNEDMKVAFCKPQPIKSLKFGWKCMERKLTVILPTSI